MSRLKEYKWEILLLCLILLLGAGMFHSLSTKSRLEAELANQEKTIKGLEKELALFTEMEKEDTLDSMDETVTNRSAADKKTAHAFAKELLTWKDYEAYLDTRETLIHQYGIGEDSLLLTTFMPVIPKEQFGTANMKLKTMEPYVIEQTETTIRYFAVCKVNSTKNKATGSGEVCLFYTLDENGNFSDVSAYTISK